MPRAKKINNRICINPPNLEKITPNEVVFYEKNKEKNKTNASD